jgi:hypothetical protein
LDTLNYEQVDFQGQKRIEGYVRYDGNLGSYIDDYLVVDTSEYATGDVYRDADGAVVGIVVGGNNLAVIDYNRVPAGGIWGKDIDTVEEQYTKLLAFNAVLRARTEGLPGPVAGLHWFDDRLYAIASVLSVTITSDTEIRVNQTLNIGEATAQVLKVSGNVITLATLDVDTWKLLEQTVERDGDTVGTTAGVVASDMASFFESRTEMQAIAEDGATPDFGWRFVHQGWVVGFENGISLYGSLPSLNQNIQGLGVQGPTTTSGNTGRPLLLTQGLTISGEKAQVAGWKSSESPSSYALNPSDVWEDDSVYTYADAYISWNGTTGQVSAPGITTGTLEQNSANNSVVVEGV